MKKGMLVSMNNSSVIDTNKDGLKEEILKILKASDKPLSTSDFIRKLNKTWPTIERICLKLQIEGKIEGFKVGRMNLWRLK